MNICTPVYNLSGFSWLGGVLGGLLGGILGGILGGLLDGFWTGLPAFDWLLTGF